MATENEIIPIIPEIKEILVIDEVVVPCEGTKICFPEAVFEMIERCKLCKKWI